MIYEFDNLKSEKFDQFFLEKLNQIIRDLGVYSGSLTETDSDPNGSLDGTKGESTFYIDGSSIFFCICAGGTVWRKVELT